MAVRATGDWPTHVMSKMLPAMVVFPEA